MRPSETCSGCAGMLALALGAWPRRPVSVSRAAGVWSCACVVGGREGKAGENRLPAVNCAQSNGGCVTTRPGHTSSATRTPGWAVCSVQGNLAAEHEFQPPTAAATTSNLDPTMTMSTQEAFQAMNSMFAGGCLGRAKDEGRPLFAREQAGKAHALRHCFASRDCPGVLGCFDSAAWQCGLGWGSLVRGSSSSSPL